MMCVSESGKKRAQLFYIPAAIFKCIFRLCSLIREIESN